MGSDVRVVVVDDQVPFRHAMAAVVTATDGFELVAEAASGEDAVAVCAALSPDLVLMDVHLPGIDGPEATRRIRRLATAPVVLLLSTHDADTGDALVPAINPPDRYASSSGWAQMPRTVPNPATSETESIRMRPPWSRANGAPMVRGCPRSALARRWRGRGRRVAAAC